MSGVHAKVLELPTQASSAARSTRRGSLMAHLSGYQGARTDIQALKEWIVGSGSADSDSLRDLPNLRARSRDLARNAPLAGGAINTVTTNVVGTGLAPQPQIDRAYLNLTDEQAEALEIQLERLWWACCDRLDITRLQSFAGLQDLVLRSTLESGDTFTIRRFKKRRGDLIGLKLQLIEADRVDTPPGQLDKDRLRSGVETDPDGAPIGYHIASRHPGDFGFGWEPIDWTRIPAFGKSGERQVLHHITRRRIGQTRGIPYLAPVITPLKQLDRYSEAEVMAAVISAMFTIFVKTEAPEDGIGAIEGFSDGSGVGAEESDAGELKLGHGAILDLAPGESIETAEMNRPNQAFDPFVMAILRQIGVGLELPFEVLIKHFTSSYSAARAALLDAWKFYRGRRMWLTESFCQPTYEWVITELVARGYVDAPGFFEDELARQAYLGCMWIGDSPGQIDPMKEAQASKLLVDNHMSTLEEETAKLTGGDFRRNIEKRSREVRRIREHGLDYEIIPERVVTESTQKKVDQNDNPEEEE